jgi:plastocyanin
MYSAKSVITPYGAAPARRVLAGFVLLACLLVLALATAGKAHAGTGAYFEPRFTKTTTNSWFFNYTRVQGTTNEYFLCFTLRKDGVTIEPSNGTNGPGSQNCTGNIYANGASGEIGPIGPDPGHLPMTVGSIYEMCVTDFRSSAVIYQFASSACQSTRIDNTKPGINTFVNGTDVYTRNLLLNIHIDYADQFAVPYPANFACLALGGGCTPDLATGYAAGCSQPNVPLNWINDGARNNSFDCQTTLASDTPDGVVAFCVRAADQAVPDNPASNNQLAQPASSANISDPQCGSVILDRTPPSASITASATTVKVGDLVNFSAASSDPISGTSGQYTWIFGDNTANGSGANTSHTYTQAGTYVAKVSTTDGAGNTGEGTQTITVNPPATGGGTGGTGGTITPPPTNKSIGNEAGGGGVQQTTFAGLGVVAPKTFKIRKGHRKLPLALTSSGPGKLTVALALGRKVVARGAATFTRAGRFGFKLKLPAKMKPGKYKLKISFKPAGATKTVTQTLTIKFKGARPRASGAAVVHSRFRAG